jgi:hypothetical protein
VSFRFRVVVAIGLVVSLFTASISAAAQEDQYDDFANDEFYDVWERTDYPVEQLETARTWIWGPGPISGALQEEYAEAGDGERLVQYFDKSRMEWPVDDTADPASDWFITQGLLATELMTGELQLGDDEFEQHDPADIPAAGDWEGESGPTYAAMGQYMDHEPRETGSTITQIMGPDGSLDDEDHLADYGVTDYYYVNNTDHNIASVFWEFMESEGLIYVDGDYETGPIFTNEFYAVGYPTTEAYWGWFPIDGEAQNVLVQCFERRCLTYAPDNPEGWQVESGNIGLHYYEWRYNMIDRDDPIEESHIDIDPADSTNPYFSADLIETFEDEIEDWVIVSEGEDWDDHGENLQETIIADAIDDFWEDSLGHTAPNHHTVEAEVTVDGDVVDDGTVDVVVEDDDSDDVIYDDEVDIVNGVATITYDASDHGDGDNTTSNTITVSYDDVSETASKTWVPFEDYDYDQEPTYLILEHYFNQDTDEPAEPVNDVGEWHDALATLLDQFGQPVDDENLLFSVDGVNEEPDEITSYDPEDIDNYEQDPDPWDGETNENGQRAFSYVGENAGDDVITAEVEDDASVFAELDKTWVEPAADYDLALAQDEDENAVGTTHTFTATLTDGDDDLDIEDDWDIDVSIERDGSDVDPINDLDVDVEDNVATISYTGPESPDVDDIDVSIDVDGTDVDGASTLTKTWVAGDPDTLVLSHVDGDFEDVDLEATNILGEDEDHTVFVEVRDQYGNLVEDGTGIDFDVRDPGDDSNSFASGDEETDGGVAAFTYDAPDDPREDEIVASWDNEAVVAGDALTKNWEVAEPVLDSVSITANPNPISWASTMSTTLTIEVEDENGDGIEDVDVDLSIDSGGGEFGEFPVQEPTAEVTTDDSGEATITFERLGVTSEVETVVDAEVDGLTSSETITWQPLI